MNELLIAVILGIVEGLTEFLPVSSTGHLILFNQWISFSEEFTAMFDIVIQVGAILSVVVYFWNRLYPFGADKTREERDRVLDLWKKTIAGVTPALVIGGLFGGTIKEHLFNPIVVAVMLLVGGIALILLERKDMKHTITSMADLGYLTAVGIGLIQCIAMIPGTSRSAATIIGAMLLGCSRVVAAEYSFFLAIPSLSAASAYMLYKTGLSMTGREALVLATGFVVSFLVAWAVIAVFMRYISRNNFIPFGWYRIVLGIVLLLYFYILK